MVCECAKQVLIDEGSKNLGKNLRVLQDFMKSFRDIERLLLRIWSQMLNRTEVCLSLNALEKFENSSSESRPKETESEGRVMVASSNKSLRALKICFSLMFPLASESIKLNKISALVSGWPFPSKILMKHSS